MGDPTHDKVMRKRPDRQGRSGLKGLTVPAWASTPKPKSVCLLFTMLCLSPTFLTLAGGYPWPPFSEKNQLRALINKSPGHERSISIHFSLLDRFIHSLQLTHMIVHNAPNLKGTGSQNILKVLMNIEPIKGWKIIKIVLVKGFIVGPMLAAKCPYPLSIVHLGVHWLT